MTSELWLSGDVHSLHHLRNPPFLLICVDLQLIGVPSRSTDQGT